MQHLRSHFNLPGQILRTLHSNAGRQSYYDVLKLQKDCSNKDIKDAFVKLSKQLHPDVVHGDKKNPMRTAEFIKIAEAYKTLGKPHLRREYDRKLLARDISFDGLHTTEIHRPWEIKPDYNPNPGPYYGIDGVSKVSNFKIAALMIALGVIGALLGFFSVKKPIGVPSIPMFTPLPRTESMQIKDKPKPRQRLIKSSKRHRKSFTFNRKKLDERSAIAGAHHAAVRANAEKFGNDEQLRRLSGRLLKEDK